MYIVCLYAVTCIAFSWTTHSDTYHVYIHMQENIHTCPYIFFSPVASRFHMLTYPHTSKSNSWLYALSFLYFSCNRYPLFQETGKKNKSHRLPDQIESRHMTHNSKQRGVSILIHKQTLFTLHCSILDQQGRYIIIHDTISNKLFRIVNLYGKYDPNNDDPSFFDTIFSQMTLLTE